MNKQVEDILLEEISTVRELLLDLIERVTRLEVKYSWVAGFWGTLGGLLAAVAVYLATRGG
jgi:hypothetical protein